MPVEPVEKLQEAALRVRANVEKVIVGKSEVIELALVALLAEGHLLIEDVPGVGKTMLAKALARSLGCSFRRIQCTPDLLPADITGVSVFNPKLVEFEFKPGPVMAQVVLVDEINRATPRTQSALLEAMEERQVTTEQGTRPLPRPFLVMATQNPVELEGTFLLPEAQLDRFLLQVGIGYPTAGEDRLILENFGQKNPLDELGVVLPDSELVELQRACRTVSVSLAVQDYLIALVHATREHPAVELGASPRAMLNLYQAARALAALRGRAFAIPDDVKYLAPFVLGHRLMVNRQSSLKGYHHQALIREIVATVPVPVENLQGEAK
jgi:MoxR-like ATPase